MTRDQYFEMCEMLGNEPLESEIPVDYEDLHEEVQEAINVYNVLQDNWDTMNGIYLGKQFSGIKDILEIMGIGDTKTCYFIINIIDRCRTEILNAEKSKKPSK